MAKHRDYKEMIKNIHTVSDTDIAQYATMNSSDTDYNKHVNIENLISAVVNYEKYKLEKKIIAMLEEVTKSNICPNHKAGVQLSITKINNLK